MIPTFENTRDQQFTLYALHQLNVTVEQLLSWSAPIDLIEKYVFYINQSDTNNMLSTETFYNCTKPWFGTQCQYSFGLGMTMSLDNIIRSILQEKFLNDQMGEIVQNLTCYTHIKCYRGSSLICLDWREICNGHIDCIDEGNDENQCFELKINQCDENEYRCDNGLCIPKDFWRDDGNNPECLDGSDELKIDTNNYMEHCVKDPTFRCEDLSCSLKFNEFTCGDGRCTTYDGSCNNGRLDLFKESLSNKGRKDKEEDLTSTPFQNICNGNLDQEIKLIDGRNHSDETDCEYWPCNNLYSRCDATWACSNGKDEDDCIKSDCPYNTRPCISPLNYTLFFCQCSSDWGGRLCDTPANCSQCSIDSVCAGSINSRSICICPRTNYGSRCLLKHCPPNTCLNDGTCVIVDGRM
ncbi:unnamed protein product, partial [Rotaria sordida]